MFPLPQSLLKRTLNPFLLGSVETTSTQPVLFPHFSEVNWDPFRWPNFKPEEPNLACPCCGEFVLDEISFDYLQRARTRVGSSFRINSAHRCPIHNARVGGMPLSQHKRIAFDISILNHNFPVKVYQALRDVGFTGFGFYRTFIHVDRGPARRWFTGPGRRKWKSLGIC